MVTSWAGTMAETWKTANVNTMPRIKNYLESPLINAVVEQIKKDLQEQDETALYELLSFIPAINLIQFLPEEKWKEFHPHKEKK